MSNNQHKIISVCVSECHGPLTGADASAIDAVNWGMLVYIDSGS